MVLAKKEAVVSEWVEQVQLFFMKLKKLSFQ